MRGRDGLFDKCCPIDQFGSVTFDVFLEVQGAHCAAPMPTVWHRFDGEGNDLTLFIAFGEIAFACRRSFGEPYSQALCLLGLGQQLIFPET